MTFRVTIQEVNTEWVKNGKNGYGKAEVVYTFNGQNRTQKLMSFSNPAVYKTVQELKKGDEVEVEVTKNDKGFNEWASVKKVDASATVSTSPSSTRVTGSNWETPDERARKQLYIIKQSSITNAIQYFSTQRGNEGLPVSDILNVAQQFVDFVYGENDASALDATIEDIPV